MQVQWSAIKSQAQSCALLFFDWHWQNWKLSARVWFLWCFWCQCPTYWDPFGSKAPTCANGPHAQLVGWTPSAQISRCSRKNLSGPNVFWWILRVPNFWDIRIPIDRFELFLLKDPSTDTWDAGMVQRCRPEDSHKDDPVTCIRRTWCFVWPSPLQPTYIRQLERPVSWWSTSHHVILSFSGSQLVLFFHIVFVLNVEVTSTSVSPACSMPRVWMGGLEANIQWVRKHFCTTVTTASGGQFQKVVSVFIPDLRSLRLRNLISDGFLKYLLRNFWMWHDNRALMTVLAHLILVHHSTHCESASKSLLESLVSSKPWNRHHPRNSMRCRLSVHLKNCTPCPLKKDVLLSRSLDWSAKRCAVGSSALTAIRPATC